MTGKLIETIYFANFAVFSCFFNPNLFWI